MVSVRFISCQREIHQKFLGMCTSMARGGLGLALLLGGFPITKNAYYRDLRGHGGECIQRPLWARPSSRNKQSERRRSHRGMFLCPVWLSLCLYFLTPAIERNAGEMTATVTHGTYKYKWQPSEIAVLFSFFSFSILPSTLGRSVPL